LSIAVIGDESHGYYDLVVDAVEDYSLAKNRIHKLYNTTHISMEYGSSATLMVIDEAVNDGAKVIILTSTWEQSEATYEAQTLYPDIKFVLLGYEPREHYFYGDPYITDNTLSTEAPLAISGFLAGYAAVVDGHYNLGFIGSMGSASIKSGVGFIAGAYYAADELKVDISINNGSYKILDHPSLILSEYVASNIYDLGTELIYTIQHGDNTGITDLASEEGKLVILGINSLTSDSEAILAVVAQNKGATIYAILENFFTHDFEGGIIMPELCEISIDTSRFTTFTTDFYNKILLNLRQGDIDVPEDYDSLMIFLDALDVADGVNFEEYIIEGVQPY
jgi:basic membrane protein A